jgi:hypothetical protein
LMSEQEAEKAATIVEKATAIATATAAKAGVVETAMQTAGQRKTNLIWERTQSIIALAVVITTCIGVLALRYLAMGVTEFDTKFPAEWWTIVGLVIGFYFGRTNHERLGGVK